MTKEQQQAISNSFARSVLFLQLSKIEFNAYKGQYPIPSLNHILGKGIAGIQEERLSEHFNEDRLMAMSSIVQYLTNCSTEQLELIESQFENTKKQNQ